MQATDGTQDEKQSMGDMMDSFLDSLSHDDRPTSVDAYQTLSNVIRQYDDIPEEDVLKAKINSFIKYMKRDLSRKPSPEESSISDTNLTVQALKVLIIFVWNKDYASLLSDESRVFILDRAVQVLVEHTAPKNVILHYLHLLATQSFRQALVTSHRVTRLLEALKTLGEHYSGHTISSERLLVYQKLVDQERPTMKAKAHLWIEELLTATTSTQKDIRARAINLGLKACAAFPASSSISAVVRSTLARDLGNQRTLSQSMCHRLEKLMTVKEAGVQVPQVWTIVLSLCNSIDDHGRSGWGPRCDKWPQFKDWLGVMQKCFNCSDSTIRQQGYQAWNRFIHIVQPHLASENLRHLLAKPITANLERHGSESATKNTRTLAVSNYCTLLYYAFRPAATHEQYGRVWNDYIMKVMKTSFFEKSTANTDIASRILMALFWNSKKAPKIWNDNRAFENVLAEPEELPTIDSKWIRSSAGIILNVFRDLMRYSSWGASGQSDKAHIAVAWLHFLRAIREASRKEIKPSPETTEAMGHVINFLGHLYVQSIDRVEDNGQVDRTFSLSIAQIRHLTVSAATALGPDLMLAGLADRGYSLSKVLVIYDSLASCALEAEQEDHAGLDGLGALLLSLDSTLVRDFVSESDKGTNAGIDELEARMKDATLEKIVDTLTTLKHCIVLLLQEDTSGRRNQHDLGRKYPKLIKITLSLLAKLPATAVQKVEEILVALFRCSNVLVVEDTVVMWNARFRQLPSVSLGLCLAEAITDLKDSTVGLLLSGRPLQKPPSRQASEAPPTPKKVFSEVSERHVSAPPIVDAAAVELSPELGSQDFRGIHADGDVSSPLQPVPVSRLRHDDSQVQFVPIESSPVPGDEPESQFLTAHQKEVRERQRKETAVVFADLRSSPRPRAKSMTRADSEFARKVAYQAERPTTPTLPTNDDQGDAEIMASPTPRGRHVVAHIRDIEVPSSPVSIVGNNDRRDITSSPPQAMTIDVENSIDLAMEPVHTAQEHDVMDLDDAKVTSAADEDERVTLPPVESLGDKEPQSSAPTDRAPGQTNQHEPADVSNVQPDQQGSLESEDHESEHGQDDLEDVGVQMGPPLLARRLSPSLRPITINLPSDSTTSEGVEIDLPSPSKPGRTQIDEIDEMSASQLSHDLHQHVSQTSNSELDELQVAEYAEEQAERQESDGEPSPKIQRSRKRKSSNRNFTVAKRRRSSRSQSLRSSLAGDAESLVYDVPGEMLDCIEVSPSQSVEAVGSEDFSTQKHPARRPQGRPRKQPVVEINVSATSQIKREAMDEDWNSDPYLAQHDRLDEDGQAVEQEVGLQDMDTAMPTESASRVSTEELVEVAPPEGTAGLGMMALLQSVLGRLKSGQAADFDLREVDDLCFQIRFEAQMIAQQRGD